MANPSPSKPFAKGDSRINRKGRPKSFDALRKLAQQIAHEELQAGDRSMTTTEAILRKWAGSKDPRLQMQFMDVAYGKVPTVTEITGKGGGVITTANMTLDQWRQSQAKNRQQAQAAVTDFSDGSG